MLVVTLTLCYTPKGVGHQLIWKSLTHCFPILFPLLSCHLACHVSLLHFLLPLLFEFSSLCIFVLYSISSFSNFRFPLLFSSTLLCTISLSAVVFYTSGKAQRWVGLNFKMRFQTRSHMPLLSSVLWVGGQMIKRDHWCVYGMKLFTSPRLSSSWWPSSSAEQQWYCCSCFLLSLNLSVIFTPSRLMIFYLFLILSLSSCKLPSLSDRL